MRHFLFFGVVVSLAMGGRSRASEEAAYLVIVDPENRVTELDRDFVRDVYLKKTTEWSPRTPVHPIGLRASLPAHDRFAREVIRKNPSQLRNYWNQLIFSGKSVPPAEADSPASVVAYVRATPGAIGYVPAGADTGTARVVRLK